MRLFPCIATICAVLGGCVHRLPPLRLATTRLPTRLSDTGLFEPGSTSRIADGVVPYTPAHALWSDGTEKRRWIRLPPGTRIDSTDMDAWSFPVGTQLWKEFAEHGTRLETRLLERTGTGQGDWAAVSYVWDAEGREATASRDGQRDVLGTRHDVPPARACMTCHGGRSHTVLGVSAIQLAHDRVADDELTLATLVADDRLSTAPTTPVAIAGPPLQAEALGYLHANCGSCHSADRPSSSRHFRPRSELDLWQRVGPSATVPSGRELARVHRRMLHRPSCRRRMPPLATEHIDYEALALIERWIATLPHTRSHE